ncbi:MAG: ABC transporter permease [Candidatus Omnitrophica bacterium]|nr:ABC transporter permease [Candidatus Omnitrophota bacterium]
MWALFLSIRFFLARRKVGLIPFINLASVLGIAVGVAALIIVLSVMNGFDSEIQEKIIGTYAHILLSSEESITDADAISKELCNISGIESAAEYVSGQAILHKGKTVVGVLLKGINVPKEIRVSRVLSYITMAGKDPKLSEKGIVLGSELMKNIGVHPGDKIELIVPYSFIDMKKVELTVEGGFTSGRYDYDANLAVVNIKVAQDLYKLGTEVTGIGIKTTDGADITAIKRELEDYFGYPYVVRSWMDLDRNLVSALALEKKMMFIMLGIIIVVACFNICSSLIMMIMEKTRDIGILKALGATSFGVSTIFLWEGFFIGALGVSIGSVLGVFLAERVNYFVEFVKNLTGYEIFPNDVYYFSQIPVLINHMEVFQIMMSTVILAVLSGAYPAWKASKADPVEAIRYE